MKYTYLAAAIFGSSVASALQPQQAQNAVITATRILTVTHDGRPVTVTSLETLFPETSINLEARLARPTQQGGGSFHGHIGGGQHFEMGGKQHAAASRGEHAAGKGHFFGGGGGAGHAMSGVGVPVSQGPPMMAHPGSAKATDAPMLQDRAEHDHESKKGKHHHHTKGREEGRMAVGEAMVTGGGQHQAAATGGAMRGGKHHGGKHNGGKHEGKTGGGSGEMPVEKMQQQHRRFSTGEMPGGAAFVGAAPSGGMRHGGGMQGNMQGGQHGETHGHMQEGMNQRRHPHIPTAAGIVAGIVAGGPEQAAPTGGAHGGEHGGMKHMTGQSQHEGSGGRGEKRFNAAEVPLKFIPKQQKREADESDVKAVDPIVVDTPLPTFAPGRFHAAKKGNHTIHGGSSSSSNGTVHGTQGGNGTSHRLKPSRKGSPKSLTPLDVFSGINKTPVDVKDPQITDKATLMGRDGQGDSNGDGGVKTVHEYLTLTTSVRKSDGA